MPVKGRVVTDVHDSKHETVGKELSEVRSKASTGGSIQCHECMRSRIAGASVSVVYKKFSIKEPSFRSSSIFAFFSLR